MNPINKCITTLCASLLLVTVSLLAMEENNSTRNLTSNTLLPANQPYNRFSQIIKHEPIPTFEDTDQHPQKNENPIITSNPATTLQLLNSNIYQGEDDFNKDQGETIPLHQYDNYPEQYTAHNVEKLAANQFVLPITAKNNNAMRYIVANKTGHKIHIIMKSTRLNNLVYLDHIIGPNERLLVTHPKEEQARLTITHAGILATTTPESAEPILLKAMLNSFPEYGKTISFLYSKEGMFTSAIEKNTKQ